MSHPIGDILKGWRNSLMMLVFSFLTNPLHQALTQSPLNHTVSLSFLSAVFSYPGCGGGGGKLTRHQHQTGLFRKILAAVGLCCCALAFSGCRDWGLLRLQRTGLTAVGHFLLLRSQDLQRGPAVSQV